MTTISVVKKNGEIAIAADTLTKWGSGKESAKYIVNSGKIIRVDDNFIAVTGNATFKLILKEYFLDAAHSSSMSSVDEIFKIWNKLHAKLKEKYFLMPEEDKEDAIESSRMDVLIANQYGIFGVSGHRTVQEFSQFYAYGSGSDYALGALWSNYDLPELSAEAVARNSIQAAAEFDDGTGLPVDSFTIKQK
jgi:ATP-dependent protease HslVU (ClpYQ) peptidase subunit